MDSERVSLPLRQVFLNLILLRVFLPLIVVGVTAVAGVGYLGVQNLLNQQNQVVQSVAQIVDQHLDHGGKILDAVARLAKTTSAENLSAFMKSTWESYGYFETLYCLDKNNRITFIMPSEQNYSGLDMSNLPDFQKVREQQGSSQTFSISRPFISVRTGDPTVYLVRALSHGGTVVGELNLGLLQKEIERISKSTGKDFVFITDQSGTLLAHPNSAQVKQQTNLSNLGIIHGAQNGKQEHFYTYGTSQVLGSAARVEKTGWVVVDQIPLAIFLSSYAWIFVLIFGASLLIWIALAWNLRKRIRRFVIAPLEQLSLSANALTQGDFTQVKTLAAIPTFFSELHKLASDFQTMSTILHARETDLQNAHDELEAKVKDRTEELSVINDNLLAPSEELQQSNLELQNEIAERRRAEEQLAQTIVEIENAHKELKSAQSQIIQQEKLASIGQLAAGVAHEINNPIGFVNSNLGTLKTYVLDLLHLIDAFADNDHDAPEDAEKQKKRIAQVKEEIDFEFLREDIPKLIAESADGTARVKRIVQDLRDFSRTGSAEWELADLHEGLDSTLNILNNEFKYKTVVLREYGSLPRVECILSQINQVFMNIVINATQAIPDHGQITIRSGSSKDEVWISISDNGKGISPENIAKIFDPFFTTKPVGMGAGLGLSVSHGIIKNHGGRIEVRSEMGQGTTFTIYLPIQQCPNEKATAPSKPDEAD